MSSSPEKKAAPKKSSTAKKAVAKKPRIRNPEQTRAKLLQATIDLLAEKGPDALSLKEAARRAEVSRGVAYQHFADRDHLLREAKTWITDKLLESMANIPPAIKEKGVDYVLEESVGKSVRLVLQNREAARLLITDALAGKALDLTHPLCMLVIKDLEHLKKGGSVGSDFDIEMLTYIMLGSIAMIVMMSHLPNAGGRENLAQRFTAEWTRFIREGMFANTAKERARQVSAPREKSSKPKAAAKTGGRAKR